nr:MAG TPA: hypothetical protein [Caudoviricetes sp.]
MSFLLLRARRKIVPLLPLGVLGGLGGICNLANAVSLVRKAPFRVEA